jgi:hypothetical protein
MANDGMKISLPGVLTRAAEAVERDEDTAYLGHSLRLLLDHLRIVRGQPRRLREFLELWTDVEAASLPRRRRAGRSR